MHWSETQCSHSPQFSGWVNMRTIWAWDGQVPVHYVSLNNSWKEADRGRSLSPYCRLYKGMSIWPMGNLSWQMFALISPQSWSTRFVEKSLTICINELSVEPWQKVNPKAFGSLAASRLGHATTILLFIYSCKKTRLQPKFNPCSCHLNRPLHKIPLQSTHNLLSIVAYRQTDRQTSQPLHFLFRVSKAYSV